ncbi:MAG: type IV secretion system protein [Sphingomonadaceae bacterium]|nr:type IV secretion system protein [Sphingomonadaceae bacterium]
MSSNCQQALDGVGVGIATSLRAVDCVANEMSGQAFGRLFAPGGAMVPALVTILTLFIAIYAILLMIGRTNLGIRALMPRMFTLGLVLTFATSWAAYQSVVWNLAIGGPDWLAGVLTGTQGSATITFADKLDVVFMAIQQASVAQQAGAAAGQGAAEISAFSPPGMMWLGTMLLLLGTVGVLVTARIALAILVGLGPIFVVMALFNGTRGLFTGWVKGVTMMALTPLFAVLGGGLMLELAIPILSALVSTPGEINPQAAVAFFLIGAVHVALMFMALKVAGTMVAGWQVFGLVPEKGEGRGGLSGLFGGGAQPAPVAAAAAPAAAGEASGGSQQRRIPAAAVMPVQAANDTGGAGTTTRETRIINQTSAGGQLSPLNPASPSRTRGIGNRFRSASNARLTEKRT